MAPSKELLDWFIDKTNGISDEKARKLFWHEYEERYLKELECAEAINWMQKVAEKAKDHNVVLVCFCGPRFEKNCHRFLLAELIAKRFNVDFHGELTNPKQAEGGMVGSESEPCGQFASPPSNACGRLKVNL